MQIYIDKVSEIERDSFGFDSLVLPEGHKAIVKALVEMHSKGPNKEVKRE